MLLNCLRGNEFYSHTNHVCYSGIIIYSKILQDEDALLDIRNWSMIKEHTEFIFEYLQTNFPSIVEFEKTKKLINIVQICLNFSIKYFVDKKEESLMRLKNNAQLLCAMNKNIYESLLEKTKILV